MPQFTLQLTTEHHEIETSGNLVAIVPATRCWGESRVLYGALRNEVCSCDLIF